MVEKRPSNCREMFEELQEIVGKMARKGREISRDIGEMVEKWLRNRLEIVEKWSRNGPEINER